MVSESVKLQQAFFQALKAALPAHVSMADAVADVLNLSYDSVYRRIRGEKPIAIDELKTLCDHFHISLDQVLELKNDSVLFKAPGINAPASGLEFDEYLKGILAQLRHFNAFPKNRMLYLCKDIPLWHFYHFPEIAAFKTFCWIQTIQNRAGYRNKAFSIDGFRFDDCYKLGQKIIAEYNLIPSMEVWNAESLDSTIKQIEYYKDAALFKTKDDLHQVITALEHMLTHLEQQVQTGRKFMPGATDLSQKADLQLYVNEVVLGSNTILLELDQNRLTCINYNVLNYLITSDVRFNTQAFESFYNLISHSTLVSGSGEKYRNQLFNQLRLKVDQIKN